MASINRRMIESLIKAGAMDTLAGTRAQKFAIVEGAMESGQRAWKDRLSGQGGLFGDMFTAAPEREQPLPNVQEWTGREKLQGEKEMLGFYVTGHPLDHYRDKVADLATHNSSSLEGLSKGNEVALCGVLTTIQKKRNREQKPWAALQLEDLQGSVELLVFTTQYERLAPMLVEDQAVLIRGLALPEEGAATKISVQDVVPLDVARVALPTLISVRVRLGRSPNASAELIELFQRKPGETQVRFRLEQARDFSVILDIPAKVRPDREFREAVEKICGAESIEVLAS